MLNIKISNRQLVFLSSIVAFLFFILSISYANATVVILDSKMTSPVFGVDRHKLNFSTSLEPTPVTDSSEKPGATPTELDILRHDFPNLTFENGTGVPGKFYVLKYDAFTSTKTSGQFFGDGGCGVLVTQGNDCFTLEYRGNPGGKNLYWIQFVCTTSPDKMGTKCPPQNQAYIDGQSGRTDELPFYLTESENATNTKKSPSDVTLTFKDRPVRGFPALKNEKVVWTAHLYLAEWDGKSNGHVKIQNGTTWGFVIQCAGKAKNADQYQSGGVHGDADRADVSITVASPESNSAACPLAFMTINETFVNSYELMDISPDEQTLYVANAGTQQLEVINATKAPNNFSRITAIDVGVDPRGVDVTPDGKKVYVTNHFDNTVSVIDATTNEIIKTIPVGYLPWGLDTSSDGAKLFVANWGGDGVLGPEPPEEKGSISVIDTSTDTVIHTIKIRSTDDGGPWGLKSSPHGKWLVSTDDGADTLVLINKDTYETKEINLSKLACGKPWDPIVTDDGKVIIPCGIGPTFFPVIQVFCPTDPGDFSKCEINTSQKLEFTGNDAINEPWSVYAKGDKIYGVDMYNIAPSNQTQEEGSLLIWDANTLKQLHKYEHDTNPDKVGIAPGAVIATTDGKIFVANSGTHAIANKTEELQGIDFDYTDAIGKGSITIPEFPFTSIILLASISSAIIFYKLKLKLIEN